MARRLNISSDFGMTPREVALLVRHADENGYDVMASDPVLCALRDAAAEFNDETTRAFDEACRILERHVTHVVH